MGLNTKEMHGSMHYSEQALYNKFFRNGWIELCNNDCGRLVYRDIESDTVRNATGTDADLLHKDSCDFLKDLREAARSFNWYPNLAIDPALNATFEAYEESEHSHNYGALMSAMEQLIDVIGTQRMKNREAKDKWDEKKRRKLEAKKLTEEHAARQIDQQSQYDVLILNADFRKRMHIDPWPTE